MDIQNQSITTLHVIRVARKEILNTLQAAYGHTDSWPNVRSRVMRIFGNDGLEGFFTEQETATATGKRNTENEGNKKP